MPTLLAFLKHPTPGRVKTRLAAAVGPDRAAAIYRELAALVLANLRHVRPRARLVGYFDGPAAADFAEWHPLADEWWPQPGGDLGERLEAGFARAHAAGGPVVAVGTDCPDVTAGLVAQALDQLAHRDAVFGPAHDGGYYLVGTARHLPGFFGGIRWSSEHTLTDHLERCWDHGWSVGLLPPLHDVDTWDDWRAYRRRAGLGDDGPGGRDPGAE